MKGLPSTHLIFSSWVAIAPPPAPQVCALLCNDMSQKATRRNQEPKIKFAQKEFHKNKLLLSKGGVMDVKSQKRFKVLLFVVV